MPPVFDVPHNVKPISPAKTKDETDADLQALKMRALAHGAAAAVIITMDKLFCSEEIALRAAADRDYPSFNWPLSLPKDDISEAIAAYRLGLFFGLRSSTPLPAYGGGPVNDVTHRELYEQLYTLVSDIESASFYMGHHLALGLAAGNCRAVFCHGEEKCSALVRGRGCIHPNKARPSMEAAGIDAAAMARRLSMPGASDGTLLAGLVMVV